MKPSSPDGPRESFALPAGAEEGYLTTNGVRLHYVAAGSGSLVLLLHGFPEFWYSWRHQLPALAERYWVVAPDLRGYNLSDKPRRGYDIRTLCGDVAGLIRSLGAQDAAIIGHDWGGVIAWALAAREPGVVRQLAIVNAPHPAALARELRHPRQLRRSLYIGFFQLPWLPERTLARDDFALIRRVCRAVNRSQRDTVVFTTEDIDRFVAAIARPGALTAALNYYRAAARHWLFTQGAARRIDVPTLVLWGERDAALGVELLDGLEGWVSQLQVRRYPDAGHWLNQVRPADVNGALLAFLR